MAKYAQKSHFSANRNFGLGETPPLLAKNPKNSEFFSVNRNFGFGKTPAPPFQIFSEKKQFFLKDASPKGAKTVGQKYVDMQ